MEKTIAVDWEIWRKLLTMLENQFGPRSEFILHDLTRNYDNTVVDIRNGHITGRKIGDCGTNLGLEVLRGVVKDGDRYNYIVHARDGKILRSSTMFIHDKNGSVIGSLCINTDITDSIKFEEYLRQYNQYPIHSNGFMEVTYQSEHRNLHADPKPQREVKKEIFANDITQVMNFLIEEADNRVGKPIDSLSRKEKIDFVRFLDLKGAFLVAKSAEKICKHLKISRFTLYNYLEIARKEKDENGEAAEPEQEGRQDT